MDAVLEFLNQPIILTLVSLSVGGHLLTVISDRRSRRITLKDKAIDFINDVADHTNAFVVAVFEKLRTNNLVIDAGLEKAIGELYSRRMSVEIRSLAYLGTEDFHTKYFYLLDECGDVMGTFMRLKAGDPEEGINARIKEKSAQLLQSWPLNGEKATPDSDATVDLLILWMELISHRVTDLLTRYLNQVMQS